MAKNVSDEVRERNQPPPTGPEPTGELPRVRWAEPSPRVLEDPFANAAHLAAEAEQRRAELAALEARQAELEVQEQAEREREAERRRQQEAADAELVRTLDAALARVRAVLPGFDTMATEIEAAMVKHRQQVAPLGINDAVADRVVWQHPLARLLPWLSTCSGSASRDR